MKRIFAAGLCTGLFVGVVALPAGAAAVVDQGTSPQLDSKVTAIDWQAPKLTQEFEAKVQPRPTDTSETRRLRQLELLEKQAAKAQARAEKLQKMRESEISS